MTEQRVIKPLPGPQMMAAKSKAKVIVYGGAAGGGKSFYQAWRAAKYVHVPGYSAIVFRRTFPMLEGGGSILDEMQGYYPALGGVFNRNRFRWDFPSGAKIELRHLQHEKDAKAHKSKAYDSIHLDEASEFEGNQFFFMISRLRSTVNVPKQCILSTNPDPDCFIRPLIDWWIGEDGYPIAERAGVVRYWVRPKDEIVWADSPDELLHYVDNDPHSVMSFTFIPAKITDNTVLMEKDPGYLANLRSMSPVERDRYLGGNWNTRAAAGDSFQRSSFKIWGQSDLQRALLSQDGRPGDLAQSIRFWDLASTPVLGDLVPGLARSPEFKARDKARDNPDWSVSIKLDRVRNGRVIISDVTFHRDTPGAIAELQDRLAIQDGPRTTVGIPREPGQAGDDQAERAAARIRKHSPCIVMDVQKKEWHAREAAKAVWRGEVYYLDGMPWNAQFFNQLEGFPDPKVKDDAVMAFSGAYRYLQEHPIPTYSAETFGDRNVPQFDEFLRNPGKARELFDKKTQIRRGIITIDVQSTHRWGRRNY